MPEFDSTIEYRPIKDFDGYFVGNDGSIWSAPRTSRPQNRNKWIRLRQREGKGSYRVKLCRAGRKAVTASVPALVLAAFVGPRPNGYFVCHFPDRCLENNAIGNIRWGTPKDNSRDRGLHGNTVCGSRSPRSKLNAEQVLAIRRDYKGYGDLSRLGRIYGVSHVAIRTIVKRKWWKHI